MASVPFRRPIGRWKKKQLLDSLICIQYTSTVLPLNPSTHQWFVHDPAAFSRQGGMLWTALLRHRFPLERNVRCIAGNSVFLFFRIQGMKRGDPHAHESKSHSDERPVQPEEIAAWQKH